MENLVLAVVGPTATGKSAMAIEIAERWGGEVVACDSTAVYRGIDIGTDKVPLAEQRGIPHHLVDMVDVTDTYSAARYAAMALLCVTLLKLFFHDLTRLGPLYRIGAVGGVAVIAMLASFAYQKFFNASDQAKEAKNENEK